MSRVATRLRMRGTVGFRPSDLTGLNVWLKAEGLGLADNAAVASWTDESGNGNHAVQADGAKQPVYKTGILNGRPVVRFDGTTDSLVTAAFGAALAQPNTVVAVAKAAAVEDERIIFDGHSGGNRHILTHGSINGYRMWAGSFIAAGTADTNPHVYVARYDGASSTLHLDGTSALTGNPGAATLGALTVGRWADGESGFFNGDIAEVLVYDTPLSGGDRDTLEAHLGAKYGIGVV